MAMNGLFSRRWRSSEIASADEFGDFSRAVSHDVHVLAVDDSLVDRKVIERLLKITSCKVTAVESGWRALQYLGLDQENTAPDFVDGLKVDLIITDYCMPGMTGYELLKKIKGSTFREVPVVIMSSENVLARIDRCLEEGAEDFIVKPVKLSDVKRLKDYMFGENNINNNNKADKGNLNKRKLEEMSDSSNSPPSSPSPPSTIPSPPLISPSTTPSPPSTSPSTSPSPPSISPTTTLSPESPSPSSTPPISPPSSPSQLESPTRRLKVTNFDQA